MGWRLYADALITTIPDDDLAIFPDESLTDNAGTMGFVTFVATLPAFSGSDTHGSHMLVHDSTGRTLEVEITRYDPSTTLAMCEISSDSHQGGT